jgi:hypothetical protein
MRHTRNLPEAIDHAQSLRAVQDCFVDFPLIRAAGATYIDLQHAALPTALLKGRT